MPCRRVRHTTRRTKDLAQSSFDRVIDYFGAWDVIDKKGLHAAFKQIRVHGIGEFLPRMYMKGDSSHVGTSTSCSSDV